MTSRERVRAVLRGEVPDRVPMDLWGTDSRMNTEFYLSVAEYLKFEELGYAPVPHQSMKITGSVIMWDPISGISISAARTDLKVMWMRQGILLTNGVWAEN